MTEKALAIGQPTLSQPRGLKMRARAIDSKYLPLGKNTVCDSNSASKWKQQLPRFAKAELAQRCRSRSTRLPVLRPMYPRMMSRREVAPEGLVVVSS